MDIMAATLEQIGIIDRGLIIYGCGLDEISPLGPSKIIELNAEKGGKEGRDLCNVCVYIGR